MLGVPIWRLFHCCSFRLSGLLMNGKPFLRKLTSPSKASRPKRLCVPPKPLKSLERRSKSFFPSFSTQNTSWNTIWILDFFTLLRIDWIFPIGHDLVTCVGFPQTLVLLLYVKASQITFPFNACSRWFPTAEKREQPTSISISKIQKLLLP